LNSKVFQELLILAVRVDPKPDDFIFWIPDSHGPIILGDPDRENGLGLVNSLEM
jgi:hypothetical protein